MLPPYKIVLLGDSSVGKTSLVYRFANDHFNPKTANTIGAAFITKEFTSLANPEKKIKFEIWDTAGQERYRSLTPMYYRNAKAALLCFDMSNIQDSFEKSQYWIKQLQLDNDGLSEDKKMKIIIVGTKSDLLAAERRTDNQPPQTNLELDAVNTYCLDNNFEQHLTSAKSGEGVQELFSSIVDSIDDSLWEEYAKRLAEEEEVARNALQFGTIDFLNARFRDRDSQAASGCC